MAKQTVKIEGLRELDRKLKQLSKKIQRKAMRPAIAAGAKIIEEEVTRRAPRSNIPGGSRGVGHMADNIVVAISTAQAEVRAKVGPVKEAGGKKNPFFYAGFLEFGTSKSRAQPFLRPGLEVSLRPAAEAFRKELARQIADILRTIE